MEHAVSEPIVLHSGVITANGNSSAFKVAGLLEGLIFVNVTAVSGTLPTLDIDVQIGPLADDCEYKHTSLTQITSTGKKDAVKLTNFGEWLRLKWTVGGTTPSFTVVIKLQGKT